MLLALAQSSAGFAIGRQTAWPAKFCAQGMRISSTNIRARLIFHARHAATSAGWQVLSIGNLAAGIILPDDPCNGEEEP